LLIKAFWRSSCYILLLSECGIPKKSNTFTKSVYKSLGCLPRLGGKSKKFMACESLLNFLESGSNTLPF
jgi:hypothetical protein